MIYSTWLSQYTRHQKEGIYTAQWSDQSSGVEELENFLLDECIVVRVAPSSGCGEYQRRFMKKFRLQACSERKR